jgi:hypothetical protein
MTQPNAPKSPAYCELLARWQENISATSDDQQQHKEIRHQPRCPLILSEIQPAVLRTEKIPADLKTRATRPRCPA